MPNSRFIKITGSNGYVSYFRTTDEIPFDGGTFEYIHVTEEQFTKLKKDQQLLNEDILRPKNKAMKSATALVLMTLA